MILLLPERRRFDSQPMSKAAARALGRADRRSGAGEGERAQLGRHFELQPRGWPMAAIARQSDAGDAAGRAWLRADPVFVRAEATGARLQGWANMGLSRVDAEDFLSVLRPVFGEAGMALSAPSPERWYLELQPGAPLPAFADPADAIGADLFAQLPQGPEGRRWRALFNEAQVLLHQHPRNAARIAAGLAPVNAVWFWGAGTLPVSVRTRAHALLSVEPGLLALSRLAGLPMAQEAGEGVLVDLRHQRDWARVERVLLDALAQKQGIELDFADGDGFVLSPRQRWRIWRRPLALLQGQAAAADPTLS